MSRPTIAQLEAILDNEEEVELEILPNGEVRAKGQTSLLETGGRSRSPCAKTWAANTREAEG